MEVRIEELKVEIVRLVNSRQPNRVKIHRLVDELAWLERMVEYASPKALWDLAA